jgi:hypothetical protein
MIMSLTTVYQRKFDRTRRKGKLTVIAALFEFVVYRLDLVLGDVAKHMQSASFLELHI